MPLSSQLSASCTCTVLNCAVLCCGLRRSPYGTPNMSRSPLTGDMADLRKLQALGIEPGSNVTKLVGGASSWPVVGMACGMAWHALRCPVAHKGVAPGLRVVSAGMQHSEGRSTCPSGMARHTSGAAVQRFQLRVCLHRCVQPPDEQENFALFKRQQQQEREKKM